MSRSWWGKSFFLGLSVLLAAAYVYPTLANLDPEKSHFPFKQKINLGLDLQGGLYLVLGIDFKKVYQDIVERQASALQERLKEKSLAFTSLKVLSDGVGVGVGVDEQRIELVFDPQNRDVLLQLVKKEFWNLRLAEEASAGNFQFGLTHDYRFEVREKTLNQSIEVIRNRIDEFGVSEPSITSQGLDRVVVELPGVREIDRAKELIGRTARLEFKMVDDQGMKAKELLDLIEKTETEHQLKYKEGEPFSVYVGKLNEFLKGKLPEGDEVAFERNKSTASGGGSSSEEATRVPYLLHSKVEVTGDDLQDASVQIDPESRKPAVGFSLNPHGANLFDHLTAEHIGHRLAIVLDNLVHSAPVIQTRIGGGKGQITVGRGSEDDSLREAKDLAIVLRAGALPARLDFLEQRIVGPSLGQDSIHKGAMAAVYGSLAVFLFMLVYYRVSGMIAVFSLVLNVLFVLAALVALEATLTLPGIAGIALTVGIAVDSNVVVYERIREELRLGKATASAVFSGFQKAFRTILDANVTNAAAGTVLLYYGTGPIKGFAVTLLIGIVTTLFTSVFACRLMFDVYLNWLGRRSRARLSI